MNGRLTVKKPPYGPEELEQMDSTEGETDEGMEKLGEVYYDAETGKYYIIENGN